MAGTVNVDLGHIGSFIIFQTGRAISGHIFTAFAGLAVAVVAVAVVLLGAFGGGWKLEVCAHLARRLQ